VASKKNEIELKEEDTLEAKGASILKVTAETVINK